MPQVHLMLDGARNNAPKLDDDQNPKANVKVNKLPPKPDPDKDPVAAFRYEMTYCVPPQFRLPEAELEIHVERFKEKLRREGKLPQ